MPQFLPVELESGLRSSMPSTRRVQVAVVNAIEATLEILGHLLTQRQNNASRKPSWGRQSGISRLQVHLPLNFFGNDGGAMGGVYPFSSAPASAQSKKAYFGVALRIETPHAAQHGGEVMSGTLVELERVMLPRTCEPEFLCLTLTDNYCARI